MQICIIDEKFTSGSVSVPVQPTCDPFATAG